MKASSASASASTFAVREVSREAILRRLSPGSFISARILESHGDGKYTVGFAGMRMIADSELKLSVGSRINVEVASVEPKIHLRVVSDKAQSEKFLTQLGFKPDPVLREIISELVAREQPINRETLREVLAAVKKGLTVRDAVRLISSDLPLTQAVIDRAKAAQAPLSDLLTKLTDALTANGREKTAEEIRDALTFKSDLKELFEKHPLKQERRILGEGGAPDAKSLLLVLARDANPELAEPAEKLLANLEARYLLGDPQPHIPFVVDDNGLRDGEISAARSREMTHVRFRLETSRLGEVVGVVDLHSRAVTAVTARAGISIGVRDADARKELLAAAPELSRSLAALGFSVDALTVDVIKRGESISPEPKTGLDLKV